MNVKRKLSAVLTFFFSLSAWSQEARLISTFVAHDPRSLALSNAFQTLSAGADSFFGNPAGYASNTAQILLPVINTWSFGPSFADAFNRGGTLLSGQGFSMADADSGAGIGFLGGIGFAGKGIGLGLFVGGESYLDSSSGTLAGNLDGMISGILGTGFSFDFFGLTLDFGADISPFYRFTGQVDDAVFQTGVTNGLGFLDAAMQNQVSAGFGVSVNAGLILNAGAFDIGLTARDLTLGFGLTSSTLEDRLASLFDKEKAFSFPSDGLAILKPDLAVGVSFSPIPGGPILGYFDPRLACRLGDLLGIVEGKRTVLDGLSVGLEIKLLQAIFLRAGWTSLGFSGGIGVSITVINIGAAVFIEEAGDVRRLGLAFQASLRL